MKAVFVRLSVATPYCRSRNPDTSSAPKPRLPPLTSATFLASGIVVVSLTLRPPATRSLCRPKTSSRSITRLLETRSVVVLDDHIDNSGHLVALKPRLAELADTSLEGVGILRKAHGD